MHGSEFHGEIGQNFMVRNGRKIGRRKSTALNLDSKQWQGDRQKASLHFFTALKEDHK
jgi:hypothetical protein